jgi:hypothetical protein
MRFAGVAMCVTNTGIQWSSAASVTLQRKLNSWDIVPRQPYLLHHLGRNQQRIVMETVIT